MKLNVVDFLASALVAGACVLLSAPSSSHAQSSPDSGSDALDAGVGGAISHAADGGEAAVDAAAADGGDTPPATEPSSMLEPPVLRTAGDAEYPASARAAEIEGSVVLKLSIDADGHVTAADVVEAAGHGFDEAAIAAALRFEFTPARRAGTAICARVLYRYEFHLPAAPPPAPPAPPAPATVIQPPPTAAAPAPPPTEHALEVNVRGQSALDHQRQSAEAVTLIDTEAAQRRSADLGDVLIATQGVNIRRDGGLGSTSRFSLNGLSGDRIRLFVDGVPLALAGYPFGIANVPVNLVDRVEIYSGVVPIRFGADALGGAVNLVTDQNLHGTHASASYQVGSFETHRLVLSAQHLDEPSGVFARVSGSLDYARNDYPIDVDVSDDKGRILSARVYRFHDAYRAELGSLEVGVIDRPWAKRLVLRSFVTDFHKDYQNNVAMTQPYGGVSYSEISPGGTLEYKEPLGHGVLLDLVGGYNYSRGHFLDKSTCFYDWFGRCIRQRMPAGETDTKPHDQLFWDHTSFARLNLSWRIHPQHSLRLALAPTYLTRSGDERLQSKTVTRDPLSAQRDLLSLVNGLEYQIDLFDARLENIAAVKQYFQKLNSEEVGTGNVFHQRDRDTMRFGLGDSLRFKVAEWLWIKAAYEFATRLPNPEEVFGDNVFIAANLALEPETSHNGNLGFGFDLRDTPAGAFRSTVNGFVRDAKKLIVLLGNERQQSYNNVYGARSIGVEAGIGWSSIREYIALDSNITYQSFRNTSGEGAFGKYDGDRIPSEPYLFANGSARLQFHELVVPRDLVVVFWTSRYVHSFYRGWESLGDPAYKQVVPAQIVHSAGLGYETRNDSVTLTSSVEVQNLFDKPVYDYFGVQRPGRAAYFKVTAAF